jgi:hypothetical protein
VEIMALYRAFSVGRFKCAGAKPAISIAEYVNEGYSLMIRRGSTRKYCLTCVKKFAASKGLRVTENESYLTVHNP